MAQQVVDLGTTADDGTGDSLRAGGQKINDNFTELYAQIGANKYGTITGIDVATGTLGVSFTPYSGDVSSAQLTSIAGNASTIRITLSSAMASTSYLVKTYVESLSGTISSDTAIGSVVFKPISTTVFDVCIEEFASNVQNIKLHFEIIQK